MRKLLFALVLMMTGAFAFGAGTPAKAMTAGGITGVGDVVNSTGATEQVYYRRHDWCWYNPYSWRCRPHHYRRHYYRRYW
jgi:chitodextrinase